MKKLRKQVSVDFLNQTKTTINDLLATRIPQSAKCRLCIVMESLLEQTKSYNGYKYLYWSKYGSNDWQEAKQKIKVNSEDGISIKIPDEFMYGPDYRDGDMDFTSDIQGKWSRRYT